ncbi:MAG: aspartate aminotransferase family protein [Desulfarculaceae bacterium]|nr:aspartate aminotransferase family protein [Desulfarculaceae bacterium]MCF8071167.1 aspartate aminotransferase family protein [Desulfarculaceae bacterium]MCF8101230.1 aspartate aminotransferase family protein [Desulfarculaceae bacterium]MCF8115221.1 aspartate aminotransferase family protein [Desulfarculaceae bacterium]
MVDQNHSHVFHRKLKGALPLLESSQGCWITDSDGRRYLDASGGAVVVNLGHARPEIAQAVEEQLSLGYYAHPTMFGNKPLEGLATALARHAPAGVERFYFMTTGSEAVETAVKLARQIHLAHGRGSRYKLIARWGSYHGLTLGALAATGRPAERAPFEPMLPQAAHIPPPFCLRCAYGLEHPSCQLRCARALAETIEELGPETVSAFLAEPVSGATLAAVVPPEGYWEAIQDICREYGVLLILDEVMTGMGRTGRWFAAGHWGISPDLMTLGKGLTGGAVPLSAVGVRAEHYRAVVAAGGFVHGGTFSHHPVGAAAGLATVGILEREGLVERARDMGARLGEALRGRLQGSPHVAQVRGLGMLWGVELVRDRESLTPYPRAERVAERLWEHLFQDGIIVYKCLGFAQDRGDALVVAPPFIIQSREIDMLADKLAKAVEAVLA